MTEFKLPELGENISQGDLVRLMIKPGATITEGQPVMELETDKAVVEVPSSVTGKVRDIKVKEGEKIKVGQVIFTVENGSSGVARAPSPPKTPATTEMPNAKPAEPAPPAATVSVPASVPARRATDLASAEFKLPELGENISQGDLVRLMISPGSKVSEGQPVMELETDKAVVEVPSSVNGVVKEVRVRQGEKIKVGQVIFTLESGAAPVAAKVRHEPVEHVSGQHAARLAFQAAIKAEGKTEEQALPPDQPAAVSHATAFSIPIQLDKVAGTSHGEPVPAAPHVRRLARELGVDIHVVPGSGPGGRISEDDVKN